jgi:hypothetical protein
MLKKGMCSVHINTMNAVNFMFLKTFLLCEGEKERLVGCTERMEAEIVGP